MNRIYHAMKVKEFLFCVQFLGCQIELTTNITQIISF